MNTERTIPDAETRARNVERWKEVCLMLDRLNLMLEQANALAQADLEKNPLYIHRQEKARKQLEMDRSTQDSSNA